jgi:hypothetical protein
MSSEQSLPTRITGPSLRRWTDVPGSAAVPTGAVEVVDTKAAAPVTAEPGTAPAPPASQPIITTIQCATSTDPDSKAEVRSPQAASPAGCMCFSHVAVSPGTAWGTHSTCVAGCLCAMRDDIWHLQASLGQCSPHRSGTCACHAHKLAATVLGIAASQQDNLTYSGRSASAAPSCAAQSVRCALHQSNTRL